MGHSFPSQFSRNMGPFPSHIFAARVRDTYHPVHHQWGIYSIPFLVAFCCTLHLPSLRGVYILTGPFSILFQYSIISLDSWGTFILPIVIFAAVIYPTFGTHGHLDFSFDCPYLSLVHSLKFQFLFSLFTRIFFISIRFCLFSLNHVFSRLVFQCFTIWGMKTSHWHCSSLIFPVYHHGALNYPIYIRQVGY